jgi:aquaporin Z
MPVEVVEGGDAGGLDARSEDVDFGSFAGGWLTGLREGVEAALILAIVLAYLTRTGNGAHASKIWLGAGAAIALSLVLGLAIYQTVGSLEEPWEQLFEGAAMLIAAAVVTWMLFWMRRQGRALKGELEKGVDEALTRGSTFALVTLAFVAVIREGVETVLFLIPILPFNGTGIDIVARGTGIAAGPDVMPPLAIGSVLMVMIYAGGHVSGAHYNPAVTVAVFLRGRCAAADVVPYWIAQLAGAAAASAILLAFKTAKAITLDANVPAGFASEFLFTFALAYVVLNVATAKATAGNSYFGLAIGFTVLAGAFSVGHVSGGAFNPAVGLGVWTMGLESIGQFGVYCVSDFGGAAFAALVYRLVVGME